MTGFAARAGIVAIVVDLSAEHAPHVGVAPPSRPPP